jgi:uncharacterized protein with GYD domain
MPQFVLLSSLTAQGRETVHANPERVLAVNDEVEQFGCRVVAQYALLGEYDFLTIVEAPDSVTVAHLSIDLGSRGTIAIRTLPAITIEELMNQLHGPRQLAAKPVVQTEGTDIGRHSSAEPDGGSYDEDTPA